MIMAEKQLFPVFDVPEIVTPTAAEELWITAHRIAPITKPSTGFLAFMIKFWN